jgi:septal ring factor EnvC (AmiA/AmiB activator)
MDGKKCELVSREVNVVPAQKPVPVPAPRTGGFPRESASDRAVAKGRQRDILEQELAKEEGLLAKARQSLSEQEAIRNGNERNYARVQERLQPFKDDVDLHQKNIEALKRELGNSSR